MVDLMAVDWVEMMAVTTAAVKVSSWVVVMVANLAVSKVVRMDVSWAAATVVDLVAW